MCVCVCIYRYMRNWVRRKKKEEDWASPSQFVVVVVCSLRHTLLPRGTVCCHVSTFILSYKCFCVFLLYFWVTSCSWFAVCWLIETFTLTGNKKKDPLVSFQLKRTSFFHFFLPVCVCVFIYVRPHSPVSLSACMCVLI